MKKETPYKRLLANLKKFKEIQQLHGLFRCYFENATVQNIHASFTSAEGPTWYQPCLHITTSEARIENGREDDRISGETMASLKRFFDEQIQYLFPARLEPDNWPRPQPAINRDSFRELTETEFRLLYAEVYSHICMLVYEFLNSSRVAEALKRDEAETFMGSITIDFFTDTITVEQSNSRTIVDHRQFRAHILEPAYVACA